MIIKNIKIRRIIDSRGNPTVEADVTTEGGFGRAAAPAMNACLAGCTPA